MSEDNTNQHGDSNESADQHDASDERTDGDEQAPDAGHITRTGFIRRSIIQAAAGTAALAGLPIAQGRPPSGRRVIIGSEEGMDRSAIVEEAASRLPAAARLDDFNEVLKRSGLSPVFASDTRCQSVTARGRRTGSRGSR